MSDEIQAPTRKIYDYIVVGGGIIGFATARQIQSSYPGSSVLLLEKESEPALHQSGRNSGVIHAGVYYKPGSLKAEFCKRGNKLIKQFCQQHDIPYQCCGKLLVATNNDELQRMQQLVQRCQENGIEHEVLDQQQLAEREPAVTGLGAIYVPDSGIVNYRKVTQVMASQFIEQGGEVRYQTRLDGLEEFHDRITAYTSSGRYQSRYLVACCGINADKVVDMLGLEREFQMMPFRGEYYQLPEKMNQIVNHLIYPMPNPELPFLGIHLTRMIDGSVTVGPNAVLALGREAYSKRGFNLKDMLQMLSYPGLHKLLLRYLKPSLHEFKNSCCKKGYLAEVQKYCPEVGLSDLQPYPAGIRAQAVYHDGRLVDDFIFKRSSRGLVVCNAPSPAATSSLPIAEHIVGQLAEMID